MSEVAKCGLCGEPMPPGEEMFNYHGHSGPCPPKKIDHSGMKLGKRLPRRDPRTLRLAKYFAPAPMPLPPDSVDWSKGITSWGMMLNDNLGDCTIAACGHAIQVWSANAGSEITVPDDAILAAYEAWDGYDPKDPSSDDGGVELDVLNQWRANQLAGHPLLAYADPDPQNDYHVKFAIAYFGGVYIGLALPLSAQSQEVWDVADGANGEPGSWGGHAVFVCGYDADGLTCITWGQIKRMTWAFWAKYCDEAHALIGQDWLRQGKSPDGFDMFALVTDLHAVTG